MSDQNLPPERQQPGDQQGGSPPPPPPPDPYGQPAAPNFQTPPPPPPQSPPAGAPNQGQPYAQRSAGEYQAPPQQPPPGYGAPPPYAVQPQPMAFDPATALNNLKLNHWLSVFFQWIPALIFFLIEKDKNPLLTDHLKEVLNLQITRAIVGLVAFIPVVGTAIAVIGGLALFVIAIIGATKAPQEFEWQRPYRYPFTLRLIK